MMKKKTIAGIAFGATLAAVSAKELKQKLTDKQEPKTEQVASQNRQKAEQVIVLHKNQDVISIEEFKQQCLCNFFNIPEKYKCLLGTIHGHDVYAAFSIPLSDKTIKKVESDLKKCQEKLARIQEIENPNLYEAVLKGDVKGVQKAIKNGANPNYQPNKDKKTPFMVAVEGAREDKISIDNFVAIANCLINSPGFNPSIKDAKNFSSYDYLSEYKVMAEYYRESDFYKAEPIEKKMYKMGKMDKPVGLTIEQGLQRRISSRKGMLEDGEYFQTINFITFGYSDEIGVGVGLEFSDVQKRFQSAYGSYCGGNVNAQKDMVAYLNRYGLEGHEFSLDFPDVIQEQFEEDKAQKDKLSPENVFMKTLKAQQQKTQ